MEFREYLEKETRLEFKLFESIHLEDQGWIADESVMDIVKGAGKVIKGAAQSGAGLMSMGDEAIARAMGDGTKGRFKGGWDGFSKGVGGIGSGVKQAMVGAPVKKTPVSRSQSAPVNDVPDSSAPLKKKPLLIKVAKDERVASGLQSLIDQYRASKSEGERNRLLAVMSMKYPKWYQPKLAQAKNREMRGRTGG